MGTVLRSFPIKMQHMIFPTADTAISTSLCWLIKSILKRSAFLETMRVIAFDWYLFVQVIVVEDAKPLRFERNDNKKQDVWLVNVLIIVVSNATQPCPHVSLTLTGWAPVWAAS